MSTENKVLKSSFRCSKKSNNKISLISFIKHTAYFIIVFTIFNQFEHPIFKWLIALEALFYIFQIVKLLTFKRREYIVVSEDALFLFLENPFRLSHRKISFYMLDEIQSADINEDDFTLNILEDNKDKEIVINLGSMDEMDRISFERNMKELLSV